MTKPLSALERHPLTIATILVVLLSGCVTTSHPIDPIQASSKMEPLANIEASPLPTTPPAGGDQRAMAEINEQNSIFFSLSSSTIRQSEYDKLKRTAMLLKEDKGLTVTLIGHANDNGSRSLDLAVADARVQSVSNKLKKLGVHSRQIRKSVVGGEMTPNTCRSAECRRKMRRVELAVSTTR